MKQYITMPSPYKILFLIIGLTFGILLNVVFVSGQAGDAIGVRVFKNPEGYSPLTWYNKQVEKGAFVKGNPQPLKVDGYPAIRDGRSVYVHAANLGADGTLYTNIYLISYNEGASQKTINIFNQLLVNWRFNENPGLTTEAKEKIRRDTQRLGDVRDIVLLLEKYKQDKGTYPKLEAGSFVKGLTFSVWPSWQANLGNALGSGLPTDPINEFQGCPLDCCSPPPCCSKDQPDCPPGTSCSCPANTNCNYDPVTCWDSRKGGEFMLPVKHYVYSYQSEADGSRAKVYTNFEYTGQGAWGTTRPDIGNVETVVQDISQNFRSGHQEIIENDRDGDGRVNSEDNCPDNANPPPPAGQNCNSLTMADRIRYQCDSDNDGRGDLCDGCPLDPRNDEPDRDNLCANSDNCPTAANFDQADTDGDGLGNACDPVTCGNNIKEGNEECDTETSRNYCDAALGDHHWYNEPQPQGCIRPIADNQCTWNPSQVYTAAQCGGYLGDGIINGTEECDGTVGLAGWDCSAGGTLSCVNGARTCNSGTLYQGACGDNTVEGPEQCDGNTRNYCDIISNQNWYAEPKNQGCTPQCLWDLNQIYTAAQCGGYLGDGIVNGSEQCDGTAGLAGWDCSGGRPITCSSNGSRDCGTATLYQGACGNNTVEGPEQCDGNTRNYCDVINNQNWYAEPKNQGCTPQCRWDPGQTYTAAQCGGYCGDSINNGTEVCDSNSQACASTFSAGLPAYCSGIPVSGTQTCNSSCSGWNPCSVSAPTSIGGTSTDCASTNATLNDYACCELVSCSQDGCACCGRGEAPVSAGYTTITSLNAIWDSTRRPYGRTSCGSGGNSPTNACRLNRNTTNSRNWQVTTNHTTATYRCWR